jgi:2-polyprenyl-6-hydroxyphenyl methylase / 3-demethylubiquinone-9 3-methyltransferase
LRPGDTATGMSSTPPKEPGDTADRDEIGRFAAQSAGWWDPAGSFAPLHRLNPLRLDYIRTELLSHFGRDRRALDPFQGLTLLDIGCGGGLVAEPMARLGFRVTAIDAAAEAIAVARAHAEESGLDIDYRTAAAESLVGGGRRFDVVLALEIVEHVADREAFFAAAAALVAPGGVLIGATLNRTLRSFALAIVGAEYLMNWLPRGTHDWQRFVRPSEFVLGLRRNGLVTSRLAGVSYDVVNDGWSLSDDLSTNYLLTAVRR